MNHNRRSFLQSVVVGTSAFASTLSDATSAGESNQAAKAEGRKKTASSRPEKFFARAVDLEDGEIYRPAKRPAYAAWVAPWRGADGSLFLSFIEKRKLPNPTHRPIPLDFWEAMGLPIKYQASFLTVPDVLSESVVLQSHDEGTTWKEVGRSITNCLHHFAYLSLPDGSILRGNHNAYLAYYPHETVTCTIQESTDLGNTWKDLAVVNEDHFFYPYRLLRLADGALFFLGDYSAAFGPGRKVSRRGDEPGNVRVNSQAAFYYSYDQGANWEGPVPVFPGVYASEPECVELPSGDVLLLNCNVAGGANTRQLVRRQGKRFVPQPLFDIVQGPVPETLTLTRDGLLVGTRRGGPYVCSKDLGNSWYRIGDIPNSLYQPRIVELKDGRLCNFFHLGGDNIVGEVDQYVGRHTFRLEEKLPAPTTLVLTRDRNTGGTQYINAYTATLRTGEQAVANQAVKFIVRASSRHRRHYDTTEEVRRTDAQGRARLAIPAFDRCVDIHRDYTVQVEFTPPPGDDSLAPTRSVKYQTYRMTSSARKKHTYAFYVAGRTLFAIPEMLKNFPEIEALVKAFGLKSGFTAPELQKQLRLSPERSRALVDTLVRHHVLQVQKDAYAWNEVELVEVRPVLIEDDFVA